MSVSDGRNGIKRILGLFTVDRVQASDFCLIPSNLLLRDRLVAVCFIVIGSRIQKNKRANQLVAIRISKRDGKIAVAIFLSFLHKSRFVKQIGGVAVFQAS